MRGVIDHLIRNDVDAAMATAGPSALLLHYRIWGTPGERLSIGSFQESLDRLVRNSSALAELGEVLEWAEFAFSL